MTRLGTLTEVTTMNRVCILTHLKLYILTDCQKMTKAILLRHPEHRNLKMDRVAPMRIQTMNQAFQTQKHC